jgi:hypothetical protein
MEEAIPMAALAHLGVGLAAKRIAPEINVGYLILGAYALDILWCGFALAGLEPTPKPGVVGAPAVWDHSLLMATVWSVLAGLIAAWIWRAARTGVVFGLVVFSHWVVDFITHPMTAVFPPDRGLPVWFSDSPLIGLGMYRTMTGVYVGEFGSLALGIVIYVLARRRMKQLKASTVAPQASAS